MSETRTETVAPVTTRRLWAGLWLAPLAWCVAGLAGYLLVSRSCEPGQNGLHLYGVGRPALTLTLLGLAMAGAALASLWLSYTSWQRVEGTAPPDDARLEREAGAEEPRAHGLSPAFGRTRFVSFAGLLASALFVLGIAYFVVPSVLVSACVQSH